MRPGSSRPSLARNSARSSAARPANSALDLGRDDDAAGAFGLGALLDRLANSALPLAADAFVDVADVEAGLEVSSCSAAKAGSSSASISAMRAGLPSRSRTSAFSITRELRLGFLVAALGLLLERGDALLQAFQVGQHQLGLDGLGVGQRVDAVLDVGDVVVLEAAQHVGDGVDLADVAQELVAEALALGGAAHEAGDVDEGQPRRDDLPWTRRSRRACRGAASGTPTSPTFGSMVQNG